MQTMYEAAGGAEGLLRLARAWHARVMDDDEVSHAFSHGFQPDHTERLAAYLTDDAQLRDVLHEHIAWATTTTMARYHDPASDVPNGLTVPRWSWQGLVNETAPSQ